VNHGFALTGLYGDRRGSSIAQIRTGLWEMLLVPSDGSIGSVNLMFDLGFANQPHEDMLRAD
jgi:hypothetical protein